MSARPLSTFQSEGWYRPSGGRADHYYRPSAEDSVDLGPYALRTLCGAWGNGGGIRPFLAVTSRTRCKTCDKKVTDVLLQPQGSPWFEMPVSS